MVLCPENNITDNAAQAWNDSITVSEDDSSEHSELAIASLNFQTPVATAPSTEEVLTVTIDLHRQGLQFGLSAQGDALLSILLSDPIPRQQLNNVMLDALRPMLASMGPWSNGYGFRHDNLHVEVQISAGTDGLQFTHLALPAPVMESSVVIEEINNSDIAAPLMNTADDTALDTDIESVVNVLSADTALFDTMDATNTALLDVISAPSSDETVPLPTASESMQLIAAPSNSMISENLVSRQCKGKMQAPIDTANLRRSNRSNKYDGFWVNTLSEARPSKSKVKPRLVPTSVKHSSNTDLNMQTQDDSIPPPTPITTMQAVGIRLCAIPEVELSKAVLTKEKTDSSAST